MRVLVWQRGRFGRGPRLATLLAEGLAAVPDVSVALSLASRAEFMHGESPPHCDLPIATYGGVPGFVARTVSPPSWYAD